MAVKISVVTPSLNQASFLERTLRSVLAQREHIHEYFVIDGGSVDGSQEIIKRYSHGITQWVSEPDRGQANAIANGFAQCTGDVLYWLNSDDVLLPGALSQVKNAFKTDPTLDVVTGHGVLIDADDRICAVGRRPFDSPAWMHWGYLRLNQPCCFFRRDLYEAVGGMNTDLHCTLDTELWYRMAAANSRWGGVDAYLAACRIHDATKGATLHKQYRNERMALKHRYPQFAGNKGRHSIGRLAYYASQLISGRAVISMKDRAKYIGRTIGDAFSNDDFDSDRMAFMSQPTPHDARMTYSR